MSLRELTPLAPKPVAASLVATLSLDYYFIPPVGKISIADPQGWLALAVFLAVSVVSTNLSARLRRQRDEMAASQVETEKLHALNRAILLSAGNTDDVQRTLLNKCMELFGFTEAALFETSTGTFHHSDQNGNIAEADLRRVAHYGSIESNDKLTGIPIVLGNKVYGSFAFAGEPLTIGMLQGLGNTIAVFL